MTERLYYQDCYLREFRARIVETADAGRRVYLDRTAFYPTSGGQPFDTGTLGGARVIDVIDEEDGRVAHVLDTAAPEGDITAHIDWPRRFDHMQQHTGQHLLSAAWEELFKIPTLSFHMGAETSSIELAAPALSARQMEQVEERCAQIVAESRPVSIDGIDRSACGRTHVRTSAEIGPLALRKTEKIRGNIRLEFVCGLRALRQARTDFRTLQEISRHTALPAGEAPAWAAAQIGRIAALDKANQRLASELAQREGRELWAATIPDADGIRRATERGAIDDATRVRAQAFCGLGKALFLAISQDSPAVLLATSPDCGVHCGERMKKAVTAAGGRGGGNAALAQGSLPAGLDLEIFARSLLLP